jgi:hypothetical protein
MFFVWAGTATVGVILQVLLIAAMLRGAFRVFKVLFVYAVVLLVTTAFDVTAFFGSGYSRGLAAYYWIYDGIRQAVLYVVVISLIFSASEQSAKRASLQRLLIAGSVLFVAFSLYFTYNRGLSFWMTQFSRNLGFLAVILNLVLWAALLKHRPDQTLLLVSGGMGIQMAGKAIGHSLRRFHITVTLGDLVLVLSHLLCLYIWWQAFRKPIKQPVAAPSRSRF